MRATSAMFLVSAALFVTGIGFVIAGARERSQATAVDAPAITMTPVATVRQIMAAITMPAANAVWTSVSTVVDADGIHEEMPRTDEEWAAVGSSAAALIESGNLLMVEGRAVDNGDWMKFARQLIDTSTQALKVAEARDVKAIVAAGDPINQACDSCHDQYLRN